MAVPWTAGELSAAVIGSMPSAAATIVRSGLRARRRLMTSGRQASHSVYSRFRTRE